jgi:hypothetical protein
MADKGKARLWADRRLIRDGLAAVPPDTWGKVSAFILSLVVGGLIALFTQEGKVRGALVVVVLLGFVAFLFAFAAWIWTGPVMALWRKEQEHRRAMEGLDTKRAAIRADFEARFSGWPEFARQAALMFQIISAEEDREHGYTRDDAPGWPEFMLAASAARVAAESLWERWRAEAINVTTPPAKLREPINHLDAYDAVTGLRLFIQDRSGTLGRLASSAGITDDYVRRLRGEF